MAGKKQSSVFSMWPKPIFTNLVKTNRNFRSNYQGAMLYAHYEMSAIELKKEVVKYLKHLDANHPYLDKIKDMHENRFATVGKYMYILNHGGDIPDDVMPSLMPALEKVINEEDAKTAAATKESEYIASKEKGPKDIDSTPKVAITIQDRLRDKAREIAGEVEGWIDDFCMDKKIPVKTVEDFINLFKSNDLKAPHMRHIREIFARRTAEIAEALEGKDKDLVEAYSNYTKPELKKCDTFNKNLLKACDMMQEVAKVERVPRKKKPVSQEKVVSKLKFKKDDKALGIVSLNPVHIIGSKEVWCFDTKTRKLIKYVADDLAGPISIKGASLIGYNEAKSSSKTLRKPATQLAEFKKCGKVQLRSFMDDIGTISITPNGRMNENCVILKIS